jgi:hypothetical protein
MRLATSKTTRTRGRRVRALGALAASITLASAALGGTSAAAQAAGWTTTYPTAASLGSTLPASDAPGGNLSNTAGSICTAGTVTDLQTAFAEDRQVIDAGPGETDNAISTQEALSPGGNWAPYGTSSVASSDDWNIDMVLTADGRSWWTPDGDNTYPLSDSRRARRRSPARTSRPR